MADESLRHDASGAYVAGAVTADSAQEIRMWRIDDATKGLKVTIAGSGAGTVTTVSVVTANGFAGSVANPTTTPAITIQTTVTGIVKGNGTALSAAVAGTDYQAPITLTTTGSTGAATFIANVLNIPVYSSAGYVVGPASSVDNAIARFDGTTGKIIQNSALTIDDTTGNITGPTAGFQITGGTGTTADLSFQTTSGVGSTGADMHFLVGNNGATEALTILNNANIGIGINAPTYLLDVRSTGTTSQIHWASSSADSGGYLTSASASNFFFSGGAAFNGSNWIAKTTAASVIGGDVGTLMFFTNSGLTGGNSFTLTERMRITTAGNVGINTTGPDRKLDVLDTAGPQARLTYTDGSVYTDLQTTSAGLFVMDSTGGAFAPATTDTETLGTTVLQWSDIFLASGAVLNFSNGNWVATHTSGILTVTTGDLRVTSANVGTNADTVPTLSSTNTFTSKRITPRVNTTTSSATPAINTDTTDAFSITALAANVTSMSSSLSGTPTNFQKLIIRFKDDGTPRTITWGASFVSYGTTLPTTTTASKVLTVGFIYDSVAAVWGCVASQTQP